MQKIRIMVPFHETLKSSVITQFDVGSWIYLTSSIKSRGSKRYILFMHFYSLASILII